jgi:hypothetical protein
MRAADLPDLKLIAAAADLQAVMRFKAVEHLDAWGVFERDTGFGDGTAGLFR